MRRISPGSVGRVGRRLVGHTSDGRTFVRTPDLHTGAIGRRLVGRSGIGRRRVGRRASDNRRTGQSGRSARTVGRWTTGEPGIGQSDVGRWPIGRRTSDAAGRFTRQTEPQIHTYPVDDVCIGHIAGPGAAWSDHWTPPLDSHVRFTRDSHDSHAG